MRDADADSGHVAADGRAELAALALAIAEQVEDRNDRFTDACAVDVIDDVASTAARRRHRVVAAVGVAVIVLAGSVAWMLMARHHAIPATRTAAPRATVAPPSPAASLGRAAAQRLGAGGRAVTIFGCQAAYDADAAASPAILPPHATSGPTYTDYLHACMSGMS